MKKALIFIVLLMLVKTSPLFACTGFVAGKNATADGSRIIARTEDLEGAKNKLFKVYPRKENKETIIFEDPSGFKMELPKISYKYTAICDADQGGGIYDAAGFNEYGLAMSATVSANPGASAQKYDPLVSGGISEASITTVVLPYAKTAREAVERTASIIDKYGSAEGNILFFADDKEIWYMEILSGHQYAAVKVPDDSYAVIPNHFLLGYVDVNSPDVIASRNLISLPQQKGFYEEYEGKFHVALTYADEIGDYERDRIWGGQNKLSPSKKVEHGQDVFSLWRKPDKKITIKDVMELQRYRYEGTELDANVEDDIRPIGDPTSMECHILQLKPNLPKAVGGIIWLAMANAEHSVYLPFHGNINDTISSYKVDDGEFNPDSFYWTMRAINVFSALDREKFGKNIRKLWSSYEDKLIKEQYKKDKELTRTYQKSGAKAASEYATRIGNETASEIFEKAKKVYKELLTYMAADEGNKREEYFKPSFK
ncbi:MULTISPECIES: C69 family dipeptidase [unclassified Treponema]|uniref:C69 family dipeptidase n=1 Tax=unclassified Treponema TaxID=2638727 RepID=UPI0020A36755|nr:MULTISPECIES: C69 family dipeptidase [unclassified Treponema]UTC66654.1 C69 family dipeptidase [Treponema sp. OMZ 789]UTC69386.1 C69 family dipeptidase [Treponema sp. OMZ 790]UTC72101.1 C69 family dipeptidase [Treponema sp. OMZ 791]